MRSAFLLTGAILAAFCGGCGNSCDGPNMCPVVVPRDEAFLAQSQIDAEFAHQLHRVGDGDSSEIDLPGVELHDQDLARLATLVQLESLKLPEAKISDAGIAHLARLERLQTLVLGESTITNEGLALIALATLAHVESRRRRCH